MNRIKDVLDAIRSVKIRYSTAVIEGDMDKANELMGDLLALENCLVTEAELYINNQQAA